MTAKRDIAFQEPVEHKIAFFLASTGRFKGSYILPNAAGKNSSQDFVLLCHVPVEVKCDYKAEETRKLYFETFNPYRKVDSGLKITKAHYIAHYVPFMAVVYLYSSKKMLAWLTSHPEYFLSTVGGDANSQGYVVPIKVVDELKFVERFPFML